MKFVSLALVAQLAFVSVATTDAQAAYTQQQRQTTRQSDGSPAQRLEIMRSRLEGMRRSLNSAVAALNAKGGNAEKTGGEKSGGSDTATSGSDALTRLRGIEREVGSLLSEVNNLRGKQERAERFDATEIDKLEAATEDLNRRVEDGLRSTAAERQAAGIASGSSASGAKKKKGFFGRLNPFGGGDEDDKYADLTGTVAPGRDRELFETATKDTRKGNYESGRLLFQTIVLTYTESPFLPLAKLAIADTFYLEGTTSALVQAGANYREWLQFFPAHPLADDVMLKMAEAEMRQMGLPDRDTTHAGKAEQLLKVLLQQFPETPLKQDVAVRLRQVQENRALHNLQVADFYLARYEQGKAPNPKGGQSRLREIVEKYPDFSYMDKALYDLGMTYIAEEEPDEAAKHFTRLMRFYPNSRYAEKAGEQLDLIGVARPTPDPEALKRPEPERPSLTQRFFSEVFGTVPATVSKDGVLISKKANGSDLIDEAIARGGELNNDRTPTAPVFRRAPARQIAPPVNRTAPANGVAPTTTTTTTGAATTNNTSNTNNSVSVQPTQAGAPPGASNVPTQKQPPPVTNPATPATGTPPANTAPPTSSSPPPANTSGERQP